MHVHRELLIRRAHELAGEARATPTPESLAAEMAGHVLDAQKPFKPRKKQRTPVEIGRVYTPEDMRQLAFEKERAKPEKEKLKWQLLEEKRRRKVEREAVTKRAKEDRARRKRKEDKLGRLRQKGGELKIGLEGPNGRRLWTSQMRSGKRRPRACHVEQCGEDKDGRSVSDGKSVVSHCAQSVGGSAATSCWTTKLSVSKGYDTQWLFLYICKVNVSKARETLSARRFNMTRYVFGGVQICTRAGKLNTKIAVKVVHCR